jgi:predicted permease
MQIFLLCLMMIGLISAKVRIIDERSRLSLSDLILDVFLPCTILASFFGTDSSKLSSLGVIFVISTLTLVVCFVLARFVLYRKVEPEQKKVLLYATIISNASFLGNPVIESIYGLEALVYSSVYLIPLRAALWTVGVAIFSGGKGNIKKFIFHPCLVATYLGFLVMLTGFTPPAVVSRLVFSLGNCTTPISMIVAGSILGMVKPKQLFTKLTLYYTFIRLVFIPLSLMGIILLLRPVFRTDPVVSGVSIILSGTPAAVTTTILANKYGYGREFASKIVFVSTLLSIVTLPALIWLLQFL